MIGTTPNIPVPYTKNTYTTPDTMALPLSSMFPNISFYWRTCVAVCKASCLAKQGMYSDTDWIRSSLEITEAIEKCGARVTIEGFDNFSNIDGPCVFIANHMSTLETFILPAMISIFKPVTFVVKESLLRYPIFHHIMRSRDPIVVERKDARADFSTVMQGGVERLGKGTSIIVFPQSTRRLSIDRQHFNSMGIKLARKAGVPAVPIALRTDAWSMGGLFGMLKDYGPIRPNLPIHFRFGESVVVKDNGKAEHEVVYNFIENALREWGLSSIEQLPQELP